MGATPLEIERIKARCRSDFLEYINDCLKYGLNAKEMREITEILRDVADFTDKLTE